MCGTGLARPDGIVSRASGQGRRATRYSRLTSSRRDGRSEDLIRAPELSKGCRGFLVVTTRSRWQATALRPGLVASLGQISVLRTGRGQIIASALRKKEQPGMPQSRKEKCATDSGANQSGGAGGEYYAAATSTSRRTRSGRASSRPSSSPGSRDIGQRAALRSDLLQHFVGAVEQDVVDV